MKLTRRTFLLGSAVALSSAVVYRGSALGKYRPLGGFAAGNPLKIPPTIKGGDLNINATKTEIFSGTQTDVLTINNAFPAPTIRIKKGEKFSAHITNNLSNDCILHWHGLRVPEEMDGHPKYAITSGKSTDISFDVLNRAGTYFYHSHTDMMTAEQVYRGLAGMFIVDDDEEGALQLPRGEFEVPLLLSDKHIDASSQLEYKPTSNDERGGFLGETMFVNGTADAYLNVAPTIYRFRIVNASNARVYNLALSNDASFSIIATDGGLIESPVSVKSCMLSPAERVDILVDFSGLSNGTSVTLKSLDFFYAGPPSSSSLAQGAAFDIMRFEVAIAGNSNAQIPTTLSSISKYIESNALRSRQFTLSHSGGMHMINSLSFSMERVDYHIPLDELEIWEFINATTEIHPMHVHGCQFQVLDRSTASTLFPTDQGWKDTVMVQPLETVRILIKFDTYQGLYLLHCHNLEHEDHGMMLNIMIEKKNTVDRKEGIYGEFKISPNPAAKKTTAYFPSKEYARELVVASLSGTILSCQTIEAGISTKTVYLNNFASGEYIVSLGGLMTKLLVAH